MINEESRPVLEFLQMPCEIGAHYPGFETDIHGAYRQADGRYTVKVLKEEYEYTKGKWLPLPFHAASETCCSPHNRARFFTSWRFKFGNTSALRHAPYSSFILPTSLVLMTHAINLLRLL